MTNSADPDQLASSEANWSGSTLFAKTRHVVFSKRRVKEASVYAIKASSWRSNYEIDANILAKTSENVPSDVRPVKIQISLFILKQ